MPERQCADCKRQKEWGCTAVRWRTPEGEDPDGPHNWLNPSRLPTTVGTEEVYSCPRQTLHQRPRDWNRLLMFYGLYQKGFLPEDGAIVDQSNVLVHAFRIIDEANAEADREEREREKRRRSRENTRGKGQRR